MESRRNQILLGIILLFFAIYFIGTQQAWITQDRLPLVMLGGALLLLYITKQKQWALWVGLFIFAVWGCKFFAQIPRVGGGVVGVLLFLLPGLLLLHFYQVSGKDNYVTPGCFGFWAGWYMVMTSFPRFANRPCSMLLLSLVMVFYTSRSIRKRRAGVFTVMVRGSLIFIIGTVLLGYF